MGEVQAEPRPVKNWSGWYGYTDLGAIEPHCIIDSLTYGCGEVQWRTPTGGIRRAGLRPLWPDDERCKVYADFYGSLKADIAKNGIKVPVLLWQVNGKHYVRYGASRLWVLKTLGIHSVPTVVCDFGCGERDLNNWVPVDTPAKVLEAFGNPQYVGTFEVSHERIDAHNMVPGW